MNNKNTARPGGGVYPWVILTLLTGSQLVMSMAAYSWGPLAPFLREEFGVTRGQAGSLVSALFFASAVVSIPSGLAVDRWGGRVMFVIALSIMGLSFIAMHLAGVFSAILIIAAVSGTGYGMINQISTKGLMYWFKSRNRAMAMGIKQTGVPIGGAVGAAMIPAVAVAHNWRWAAVITGILILAAAVAVVAGYRDRPQGSPANDSLPPGGTPSGWRRDLRALISKRTLMILSAASMLMSFSQTSITSFWVLYLQEALGFSLGTAGTCLTVLMAAGAAGRIAWGVISDGPFKGDRQKPMIILGLAASACALGVAFLASSPAGWLVYCLSALLGFTFMGWNAVFITLGAETAGPTLAGSAAGLMLTAGSAGVVLGPPVFGATADSIGYFWGWLTLALFGLAAALSFIYSVSCLRHHKLPVDPDGRK